jgi:hypothetical protein
LNTAGCVHISLARRKYREKDAKYLDTCRNKRNITEYDYVGGVTEEDVEELIIFVNELREEVIQWPKKQHPDFLQRI